MPAPFFNNMGDIMNNSSFATRRIFISDIHMGDDRSQDPPDGLKPYGCFDQERSNRLAGFLNSLTGSAPLGEEGAINEVVILGDLFDLWTCPASLNPFSVADQVRRIAHAEVNAPAMESLRGLIANPEIKVVYTPGNHDMLVDDSLLHSVLPGIGCLRTRPGEGIYLRGDLHAEHGNLYCLFNAPDRDSNPGHSIPLGYFMTRLMTQNAANGKGHVHILDALETTLARLFGGEGIAGTVFLDMASAWGLEGQVIIMDDVDGYGEKVTLDQVETIFEYLYGEWKHRPDAPIDRVRALSGDMKMLYPAARKAFSKLSQGPSVVLFGHTHAAVMHGLPCREGFLDGEIDPLDGDDDDDIIGDDKDVIMSMESRIEAGEQALKGVLEEEFSRGGKLCRWVYANTGTWVSSVVQATFVEVATTAAGLHRVTLSAVEKDGSIRVIRRRWAKGR